MGGLGKTTLAQLVYNHEEVKETFQLRCRVYVSENFQVKEIMKKIIESIDKSGRTLTQLDTLQESLQNKLRGKKFLILLDDVWIETSENEKIGWEELRTTLSCGAEGSIIVLTTLSQTTCQMFAKVPELQHNLECLSKEDSWLLIKNLAFAEGREGGDISELENIGRDIVEKCKGLPLAVKTLGSLMWSKRSTSDWQRVKDNSIWELKENKVLPALKLSYDNLLPHVKRCFAYCCLFPKGYELEMDELVPLWVATGFIPLSGEIDLYVLGEEIFNCLVWRSFFQEANNYRKYKIHDMMHDMARQVMGDDCLVIEPGKEVIIPNDVLHLSFDEKFYFSFEGLGKLKSLRSIFIIAGLPIPMFEEVEEYKFITIFNQVYLRVLYLPYLHFQELPESICRLKHMRYLNLSNSAILGLPESIMYLQNLQVLILRCCVRLCKLPESIYKLKQMKDLDLYCSKIDGLPEGLKYMTNLQRLNIKYCDQLKHLPSGIYELKSIRILSKFIVGNKSGPKIGELGDLNILKGELEISRLENVGGLSDAKSANLNCKRNLSVLELKWSDINTRESELEGFKYDEEVLEGLEPNPSLKELMITYYMENIISPSWMVNLRNLVKKCMCIPPLGKIPNLRVINLWRINSLKCFHEDDRRRHQYLSLFTRSMHSQLPEIGFLAK